MSSTDYNLHPDGPPKQRDPRVELFSLGDFELQSGEILHGAYLAFRTYGSPSLPCIVYPTWFSGTITAGNEWLISTPEHPRRALDPSKYFIVVPALFGNGESSSPSNTSGPHGGVDMPKATFYDNVRAQHKLVTEKFGKKELFAVTGWSMGAGQTFQWASQYPDMVKIAIPSCGAARTSLHNQVFLAAVKAAIEVDPAYAQGHYMSQSGRQPEAGLKAMARVYAGWGFSQTFYREGGFARVFGLHSLKDILEKFWEGWTLSPHMDANNLLYMLWTWTHGDIGAQPAYAGASKRDVPAERGGRMGVRGDLGALNNEDEQAFKRALKGTKAQTLVMPGRTDLYFPPEDSEIEVEGIGENAKLNVIESIGGHWAGGPGDLKEDATFIDDSMADWFERHGRITPKA